MSATLTVHLDSDVQSFAEYAHRLLALAETGELTVCLSSLSFSNLSTVPVGGGHSLWR